MRMEYTAKELAAATGRSRQRIQARSQEESWPCREIKSSGGIAKSFRLVDLPFDIQAAVRGAEIQRTIENNVIAIPMPVIEGTDAALTPTLSQGARGRDEAGTGNAPLPNGENVAFAARRDVALIRQMPAPTRDKDTVALAKTDLARIYMNGLARIPSPQPSPGGRGSDVSPQGHVQRAPTGRGSKPPSPQPSPRGRGSNILPQKLGSKEQWKRDFIANYNAGMSYPGLFRILGTVSLPTLERWKQTLAENPDFQALSDRRGQNRRGECSLSLEVKKILLECVLNPNKPRISEAIRRARMIMERDGVKNGHADATYRRFLLQYRDTNLDKWYGAREGMKAVNDKCRRYLERDFELIEVGEVLIADGHTLNFEILNPWTGKPKRMTLILWYDMRSNFPLGWEIMPTENTRAIASALRHAIIRLGKIPKVAYLDNGKAFGSRFFAGVDFEQAGISGLFARLGMETTFAWPYHAQSKTVERFFGSLSELERLLPSYTGTSIENKPPRLNRGEKLHRAVWEKATGGRVLTLAQAHAAIAWWFDEYVRRPQAKTGKLKGACPMEVFEAGQGPGVDIHSLDYLMMEMEIRKIYRNGIRFNGEYYWSPELYGRSHQALIRYDLQDPSYIIVYDQDNEFLCEARPQPKVHPMAKLGTDEDRAELKRQIEESRTLTAETTRSAKNYLKAEVVPTYTKMLAGQGLLPEGEIVEIKSLAPKECTEAEKAAITRDAAILAEESRAEAALAAVLSEEARRYLALLEEDLAGEIGDEQRDFMVYFEDTEEYRRRREWFEAEHLKLATRIAAERQRLNAANEQQ